GAYGTLGLILSVSVRLHPVPADTRTALGAADDPDVLASAATALTRAPLELEALDVAWRSGRGGILARLSGVAAEQRGRRIAVLMRELGLSGVDVADDDEGLWARQRAGQRAQEGSALVRVAARPSSLSAVLRGAEAAGGTV